MHLQKKLPWIWASLPFMLMMSGCSHENKISFEEGSKLDHKSPLSSLKATRNIPPQVVYAFHLMKEAKYKEASVFINQTLQSYPSYTALHILNALAYEKLAEKGDASLLELAAVGYQNALHLDPNNYWVLTQLGKLRYEQKQFAQAQELFANALLIKPNNTNLLHELAAASYYAYDLKTALNAIEKAKKLAPNDPLIDRSASIIYAALGDFSSAKTHFDIFKNSAGNDPDVARVEMRVNDWSTLYKSGRIDLNHKNNIVLTSTTTTKSTQESPSADDSTSQPSTTDSTESNTSSATGTSFSPLKNNDDTDQQVNDEANQALGTAPLSDLGESQEKVTTTSSSPQIIVDCYMLRITEDAITSKGNNILEHLSVTLSSGGTSWVKGHSRGSLLSRNPDNSSSLSHSTDTGYNTGATNGSSFTPATNSINYTTPGSLSSRTFAAGLTWAGLTYSLNIANAVDRRNEVVARPSLLTFIGKQSVFFSGSELINGIAGQYGGSLIKYPVGVTLAVKPTEINKDVVTLDISMEGSLLTDPSASLQSTVNVGKTRVDTSARVRLGETLMLGGIYQRIEELSNSGVPGLQNTPILEYFFSNESTVSSRQSIVFMLTPRSPDAVKVAVNRAMSRQQSQPKLHEYINRNPDWLNTHPNMVQIFKYLSIDPIIYYEFRNGDILPPHWGWGRTTEEYLNQIVEFLYY